jgi:hypothetical protein
VIAPRAQESAPSLISLSSRSVLSAVEFDRELLIWTAEIHDESADRMLAAKLRPA